MRKTKKAQQEIMGLAIIVVLVILAIAFWFMFTSGEKDTEQYERQANRLASYTSYAIFDTTTECKSKTFEELLLDCVGGNYIDCYGESACDFSYLKIDELLADSIGEDGINKRYILKICEDIGCQNVFSFSDFEGNPQDFLISNYCRDPGCVVKYKQCPGNEKAQSTPILLMSNLGEFYYLVLEICL